ncbi:hypothetical protein Gpo141_00003050 [Globisporangium polare]
MRTLNAPRLTLLPPALERYRSDSLPVEPRLSVCSTSGMVYESVVVVGHVIGNDNIVYYLLEVRSWEMPLEGYVVRRRYNDFKKFHQELAKHMPGSKPRSSSLGIEYAFSSLLCNPLSGGSAQPEMNPLWSPKRSSEGDDGSSTRRNTRGSSGDDLEAEPSPIAEQTPPAHDENEIRDSGAWTDAGGATLQSTAATLEYSVPSAAEPGMTYYDSNLTLPLDSVRFNMAERAILPDMPAGGVSAIFSTRQMLIKYRVEQFNKILAAVMSDNSSDVANVLMNFIQEKPGGQVTSYTSLSEYAAIDMPWRVERYARRRAMSMGRRPPMLFRDQSTGSSSTAGSSGTAVAPSAAA